MRGSKDYLCWLMNEANIEAEGDDGYLKLCEILQETLFEPFTDMDENRIRNAEDLRMEWSEYETEDTYDQELLACMADEDFSDQCSFLELMVILARNMQYEMLESDYEAGVGKWFRELMDNSGLSDLTNEAMEDSEKEALALYILHRINGHRYDRSGEGGFFPLSYPIRDQRRLEIMDQMNDYLAENYDIC